ncbi:MAG: N-acetyltransferase [Actinomycetota bacterium]|nr:N-acetyltransferase [Actinomycetota bacterium]
MEIRPELPTDASSVRRVHRIAFGDHGQVVGELVADLRQLLTTETGLSYVAVEGSEVVGHILFTPAVLDAPRELVAVQVLSPLAVLPTCQGSGVGSALVTMGIQIMAARSVPVVFLEGDPDYYSRFGFLPGEHHCFRRPSLRIPKPAFQALTLPSYESWMTGTLVYPDAFWRHDAVGLRGADRVAEWSDGRDESPAGPPQRRPDLRDGPARLALDS